MRLSRGLGIHNGFELGEAGFEGLKGLELGFQGFDLGLLGLGFDLELINHRLLLLHGLDGHDAKAAVVQGVVGFPLTVGVGCAYRTRKNVIR